MGKWYIAGVVGVVAIFLGLATARDEIACRGVDLNMTAEQKSQVTDCLAENGIKSIWKIPGERLSCFGVCILRKKKLLTADGKLNHDKILNYIMDVMKPDEVKVPLKDGTEKCMKEHGNQISYYVTKMSLVSALNVGTKARAVIIIIIHILSAPYTKVVTLIGNITESGYMSSSRRSKLE